MLIFIFEFIYFQAQCLINVRGDTVSFSYEGEIYPVSSEPSRKNSDSPIIINTEKINCWYIISFSI
jgi:hypothetical protein